MHASSPASVSNRYVWRVEDKPVSVHLSLDVVARMQSLLACSPGVRPPEQGGILLGQVRRVNESWMVAVEDFVTAECEHLRGASWTLSARDRQQLGRQVKRLKGKGVVGWFRTHTRPGLFLDQYDFRLFSEFFSHPACVALAIRPDPVKGAEAGFFFWDNGDMRRATPYRSFPFRPDALAPASHAAAEGVAAAPPVRQRPAAVPAAETAAARAPRTATSNPGIALATMSLRRKALYATPIAAGLAAGFFWQPRVVQNSGARSNPAIEQSVAAAPAERAVFGPPPEPEPVSAAATAAPVVQPEPLPPQVRQERARHASPPVKKLVLADNRRHVAVPEPKLDFRPPEVQVAARLEQQPVAPAPVTPRMAATVEPVRVSVVRRAVGSIPGLGFLKRKKRDEAFVPPRPIRQIQPRDFALKPYEEPVRVKVMVDTSGEVASAEVLSRRVEPARARAAVEAAWKWRFSPATENDKPVSAELILSFGAAPASGRGI
jgi:TonB family protein